MDIEYIRKEKDRLKATLGQFIKTECDVFHKKTGIYIESIYGGCPQNVSSERICLIGIELEKL